MLSAKGPYCEQLPTYLGTSVIVAAQPLSRRLCCSPGRRLRRRLGRWSHAANTSTTSVTINNGTTATETTPPDTAKAVAAGAITGATTPMVDYLNRATAPIGPTIQVENGQPVTVILAKPVVFDGVPDAEWRTLEGDVDGNSLFK